MSRSDGTEMKEVQNPSDIPEFENELEEAEFWESHTLGDDFLNSMGPLSEEILPIDHARKLRKADAQASESEASQIQPGQVVTVDFQDVTFDVIVIDPNGLGLGHPTVGFTYYGLEKTLGLSKSFLSKWINNQSKRGLSFSSFQVTGVNGCRYSVIEASDVFQLIIELLENPKWPAAVEANLFNFLKLSSVKGLYAAAYSSSKGSYTAKDSRVTTKWLESHTSEWLKSRHLSKVERKLYTDLLKSQGGQRHDYAYWTNYIYSGLFGFNASIVRERLSNPEDSDKIRFCESMVVRLFTDDLEDAHDQAISVTRREFFCSTDETTSLIS
jgi:hypothetical protein